MLCDHTNKQEKVLKSLFQFITQDRSTTGVDDLLVYTPTVHIHVHAVN